MFRPAIALTAALCAPLPAVAQDLLTGANPFAFVTAIRDEGYKAELSEDDSGNPKIDGRMGRSNYSIFFLGCDDSQGCNSVQFSAGYGKEAGWPLADVNAWNRAWRYGKAHVDDEGNPYLKYDVNTDFGITRESFADSLDIWRILVSEFEQAIEW